MKHILSISLGASSRDTKVTEKFLNEDVILERRGTDGDKELACKLIKEYDGKVDAFGLGGTDLYIYANSRRYAFSESLAIAKCARITPIVDGSGVKDTLERQIPTILKRDYQIDLQGKTVLLVCAVDRFGLAEALAAFGCEMTYGDLVYGLGINYPLYSLRSLGRLARMIAPVITKLPIKYFYPIGNEQNKKVHKYPQYFEQNEVIAGDFHLIKRYMPEQLTGKTVITNTVTREDREILKSVGAKLLVTTSPEIQGRSFGTNVLEALLVAMGAKQGRGNNSYMAFLDKLEIKPRVEYLN